MKRFVLLLLTIILVLLVPTSFAGGGHGGGGHGGGHYGGHGGGHGSVFIGYSGYYPAPYYYYPPYYPARVSAPAAPTIYVEKSAQAEPYYWYYCTEPKGYFPHVERCPTGWLQVVPRSPQN